MKVAVIGAGIIGITTAYELASDGHQVQVIERRGAAAEESSFANAGVIAPGYLADLNVIDPDRLNLGPPEIVQDLPAGGTRLLQPARGYLWTVKSGVPTFENGVWTGQTPGGLLRGDRPGPQQ